MNRKKHAGQKVPGFLSYQKSLDSMTLEEGISWLAGMKERLAANQQRERRYLDRRARRGTHTPTDDAYEQDQVLESELLALLDGLIEQLQRDMTGGQA